MIKNKINGKLYIGQTKQGYKIRFGKHCSNYNSGVRTPISVAIHEFGKENFEVQLLKTVSTKDESDFWEECYIKDYKSLIEENGYNVSKGGKHNPMESTYAQKRHYESCHSVEFRELQRKLSTGKKHTEATKELCRKRTLENLEKCCAGFKKYNDSRKVRVGMCIEYGVVVKEFESASDACRYLNKNNNRASEIIKATYDLTAKGEHRKVAGYYWVKLEDVTTIPVKGSTPEDELLVEAVNKEDIV